MTAEAMSINEDGVGRVEAAFRRLLGVGWDKVFQWTAAGYASAWFWLNADSAELGPVDWGIDIAGGLGLPVPRWIADSPDWLETQQAWLAWALPLLTAVLSTAYVRTRRGTGLLALAIVSGLLAVQVAESLLPILWAVLLAAVPAGAALAVASYQRGARTDAEPDRYYFADHVWIDFVVAALAFAWLPVLTPVIGFGALVAVYGKDLREDPRDEMAERAMARLRAAEVNSAADGSADAITVLAAALLTDSSSQRRRLAGRLHFALTRPIGAASPGGHVAREGRRENLRVRAYFPDRERPVERSCH